MDRRIKEAIRYLGYKRTAIDEKTLIMIQESFQELEMISELKSNYCFFELLEKEDALQIDNLLIKSQSLQKNLKGCTQVVLLCATMGLGVDRMLRTYEITDMAKAVVMQACAAAMLEEYCDKVQNEIAIELSAKRLYLRPRFSPGYGDFSILHQQEILDMLDAPRKIGLTMTDAYMLAPIKSVTAVIGISKTKEPCHQRGCEECAKHDCLYRRS